MSAALAAEEVEATAAATARTTHLFVSWYVRRPPTVSCERESQSGVECVRLGCFWRVSALGESPVSHMRHLIQ